MTAVASTRKLTMRPRPRKRPAPSPAPTVAIVPAPVPAWQLHAELLARQIQATDDDLTEKYVLRLAFLRVRYTPWRQR